jgi:hypothetical protein
VGTVTNTLTDPSGRGLRDVTVRIALISPANPFLRNGSGEILSATAVNTDDTGTWSALLTPASALADPTAYYLVDETCAPGGHRWPIAVPDGDGPFTLQDILAPVPATPGSGPTTVFGANYHHDQATPARVWTITHNLGYRPNLRVADSAGSDWYGWTVTDVSTYQLTVDVGVSMAGTAELS